jgi:hypothetical protein
MIDSIAENHFIQHLDLKDSCPDSDLQTQMFCDVLLRQNSGLRELEMDVSYGFGTLLTGSMQLNTNLKSLSLEYIDKAELVTFAEGLATMRGLRKLALGPSSEPTEEFFQKVLQSLEHNDTLWTLAIANGVQYFNAFDIHQYLPKIRYFLAINRVGRHRLLTLPMIPMGLWAYVLVRSSHAPDGIYFCLTQKPDLITPSRKRKSRDGDVHGIE